MSGATVAVFQNLRGFATVPGAPTIGTATSTGTTTATVSFTAPSSNGGATITLYTATSSPGGITGTLSQSGSGTITVNGLNSGTSYTFTVTATNSVGTSSPSSASNSITTSPTIGGAYAGGYYAGQINVSGTIYNLVVSDASVGQARKPWKTGGGGTTGVTSLINGPTNSATLAALGSNYEAATFCENLNSGGYTDWYMPALYELEVMYYYLKPSTALNVDYRGANPYAVSPEPINTNHTTTNPAQTTVNAFKLGQSQAFADFFYYTSAEDAGNPTNAVDVDFNNFYNDIDAKGYTSFYVRACRRVAA